MYIVREGYNTIRLGRSAFEQNVGWSWLGEWMGNIPYTVMTSRAPAVLTRNEKGLEVGLNKFWKKWCCWCWFPIEYKGKGCEHCALPQPPLQATLLKMSSSHHIKIIVIHHIFIIITTITLFANIINIIVGPRYRPSEYLLGCSQRLNSRLQRSARI